MKTTILARLRSRIYISTALAIAGLTFCLTSQATPVKQASPVNLVKNGDFSVGVSGSTFPGFTNGESSGFGGNQPALDTYVTNWLAPASGTGRSVQFVVTTMGPGPGAGCRTPTMNCLPASTGSGNGTLNANNFGIPFSEVTSGRRILSMQGLWTSLDNGTPNNPHFGGTPNEISNPISQNGFRNPPMEACLNGGGAFPCNYVVLDGAQTPDRGIISQTISGLTNNHKYDLSFWFAASQLRDPSGSGVGASALFNGQVADGVQVLFGGSTFDEFPEGGNSTCAGGGATDNGGVPPAPSANCTIGSRGFKGWKEVNLVLTAHPNPSGQELLTLQGLGAPGGLPPMSLVTGVDLKPVPEPSTWTLVAGGLGLLGKLASKRRRRLGSAAGPGQDVV